MTKILAALDAITERVFAYRPKDKGQWAAKTKRQLDRKAKEVSALIYIIPVAGD